MRARWLFPVTLAYAAMLSCDPSWKDKCTECPDGHCYFLYRDVEHCGSCENSCAAGQICNDGTCTSTSGSCPFVFLWEDGKYRYATDLSGSPLAKGLGFFKPQFYGLNVYSLGDWRADQGVYRMRLRELTFEASFVDQVTLALVDVPEGYAVFTEWSSTPQLERAPSLRYVSARLPLRAPRSATAADGSDVLALVSAADGQPLPVRPDGLSQVVVDFGPVEHPEWAHLIVTTWGAYGDYRTQLEPPYSAGTLIETLDATGQWTPRVLAGKSASDAKTWSLNIASILSPTDSRMRITLAHQQSTMDVLDAVFLDDSEPLALEVQRVQPRAAALGFRGAASIQSPIPTRPAVVADDVLPIIADALLEGSYTRYGEVGPLLATADDRFAIMAHGDELALEFEAPPQAAGTHRWVFIEADVFYTLKYHPFGQLTDTIEPLPFHGLPSYPYPPDLWPYREDPAYQAYLRDWNTRVVPAR